MRWWGGWGIGEDLNTIIRYLLEEMYKYENNFTHFLYTRGSDVRLFNTHISSIADVGREISVLQDKVSSSLLQMNQTAAANRMFVTDAVSKLGEEMKKGMNDLQEALLRKIPVQQGSSSLEHEERMEPPTPVPLGICEQTGAPKKSGSLYNHIPGVKHRKEAINQWEVGCPSKNLTVPLKNWPRGTRTKDLKYKFHDRKLISLEYLRLGETEFLGKYDQDNCTLKDLKHRIRIEHKNSIAAQCLNDKECASDSSPEQ